MVLLLSIAYRFWQSCQFAELLARSMKESVIEEYLIGFFNMKVFTMIFP